LLQFPLRRCRCTYDPNNQVLHALGECPLASGTAVSLGQGWPVARRFWNLAKPFGWEKRIKLLFPQKAPDRGHTAHANRPGGPSSLPRGASQPPPFHSLRNRAQNPLMWMHRHEILNEARHTYPRTIGLNLTSLCPANFPIIMPSGQAAKRGLSNLLHLPSAMHHLPSSSDTGLVASPVDRLDGHAPCRRPCFGPS
jgi:hypothetical protein